MATEIKLRNPATGQEASAYRGYSWTSLCFGAFPALFRGDIALGLAVLVAIVLAILATMALGLATWIGSGLVGLAWGFVYNDIHLKRKLAQGFEIVQGEPG